MDPPGLVILPSFISTNTQKELVQWSLRDQARYPNETNLDIHHVLPERGLWNVYLDPKSRDTLIHPRESSSHPSSTEYTSSELPGPRKLIENTPATPDNFHTLSTSPKLPPAPSTTTKQCLPSSLIPKLRWANIGWFYHWGSKQYDLSKERGCVHPKLRAICKSAVSAVNWEDVFGDDKEIEWGKEGPTWKTWDDTYEPDAGIVNFYQTKDTLMAHVDRSEACATSPLVSISLGNAAVFLIGGLTRDVEPIAILLRSGDVAIMSGPGCRRAYHGVPRILENTLPCDLQHCEEGDDREWKPYREYLLTTRININVRQVFPKDFERVVW